MNDMIVLLVLAAATWLLRIGLLVLVPASRLPTGVRASLEHLAPAVLAAILVVDLSGSLRVAGSWLDWILTLAAAALIAAVASRSRSLATPAIVALAAVIVIDVVLR